LKTLSSISGTRTRLTSVGTVSTTTNCTKGAGIPLSTAISKFWGFPMGVMAEPAVRE
jgi:hypothetical protein